MGDKTIIFRLIDADMYWHMQKDDHNFMVDRGIALHKMIRLVTASTINGGYLNFMGNEIGQLREWDEKSSGIRNGSTSQGRAMDGLINTLAANGIWWTTWI